LSRWRSIQRLSTSSLLKYPFRLFVSIGKSVLRCGPKPPILLSCPHHQISCRASSRARSQPHASHYLIGPLKEKTSVVCWAMKTRIKEPVFMACMVPSKPVKDVMEPPLFRTVSKRFEPQLANGSRLPQQLPLCSTAKRVHMVCL
jgi:hypothetical protein